MVAAVTVGVGVDSYNIQNNKKGIDYHYFSTFKHTYKHTYTYMFIHTNRVLFCGEKRTLFEGNLCDTALP
jgi:hypothetical protein